MKHMFERSTVLEIKERVSHLKASSTPLWGEMNAGQAMAHCAASIETALGERVSPRLFIGRIIGRCVKPKVFESETPLRKNSPTTTDLVVRGSRDLEVEKKRVCDMIDRFSHCRLLGRTEHPHAFFGKLTPDEWSILTYKHLDHHLRQFGV